MTIRIEEDTQVVVIENPTPDEARLLKALSGHTFSMVRLYSMPEGKHYVSTRHSMKVEDSGVLSAEDINLFDDDGVQLGVSWGDSKATGEPTVPTFRQLESASILGE